MAPGRPLHHGERNAQESSDILGVGFRTKKITAVRAAVPGRFLRPGHAALGERSSVVAPGDTSLRRLRSMAVTRRAIASSWFRAYSRVFARESTDRKQVVISDG